jgi:hypothetical protein
MASMLEGDFYLVVKKKNGYFYRLSGRLTSGKPSKLDSGEVAIKLSVSVPHSLFDKPQFQATVTIPQGALTAPVIDATVIDNVREIIEQQTGMDIKLSLVEPESLS